MAFVEDDECDYCHGKGWYLMDGKKERCFCVDEKRKAITDKTLLAIGRNPLNTENARAMARELLAARKVVRAAKRVNRESQWPTASIQAMEDSLDAYDNARKGKVST